MQYKYTSFPMLIRFALLKWQMLKANLVDTLYILVRDMLTDVRDKRFDNRHTQKLFHDMYLDVFCFYRHNSQHTNSTENLNIFNNSTLFFLLSLLILILKKLPINLLGSGHKIFRWLAPFIPSPIYLIIIHSSHLLIYCYLQIFLFI